MHILLKNLLKEVQEDSPIKYQFYCDMDGVLVDLDKGFRAASGGLSSKEYEDKNGPDTFWNVVDKKPNFWLDLEPLSDAKDLWEYIKATFKDPPAVILSAGQGTRIKEQKTAWIRKHIDPSVQVIIASGGLLKPNYVIERPGVRITHILLDDTKDNIDEWKSKGENRIGILHEDAASSIEKIKQIVSV